MNIMEAIEKMEKGCAVKRTDWNSASTAYITLEKTLHSHEFYISGHSIFNTSLKELYRMSYDDIRSDCWEVCKFK